MKITEFECNSTPATETDCTITPATATSATSAAAAAASSSASKPNVENVSNNHAKNGDAKEPSAITTATNTPTTMTDERNSNHNSHQDSSSNNNNSKSSSSATTITISNNNNNNNDNDNDNERIIAEAAKIFLKNGLNGTNAAAAAAAAAVATASLLSAATFQLPAAPGGVAINSKQDKLTATTRGTLFQPPPPAHLGGRGTTSNSTSTSTSNGAASAATTTTAATTQSHRKAMAAAAALSGSGSNQLSLAHMGVGVKTDIGVIDYTVSTSTTANSNNNKAHSTSGKYSSGGVNSTPSANNNSSNGGNSFGGRLQFFKDGKVILELARSREGDKGGWVSVPRKQFRSPSTTSSTVTPTLASSTAYPKNESSTSLSFSDDNSSIQSSPWQRDHCWKQTTPRRGISQSLSLLYQRPKGAILTRKALLAAQRKRRRPNREKSTVADIFEYTDNKANENGVKNRNLEDTEERVCSKSGISEGSKMPVKTEQLEREKSSEIVAEDDGCSTSSTATLTGGNDCADAGITGSKTPTPSSPQSDAKTDAVVSGNCAESVVKVVVKKEEANYANVVEKMNTSEDEEAMSTDEAQHPEVKANGDIKQEEETESKEPDISVDKTQNSMHTTAMRGEEKRLKKPKTRAKLTTIIQKLIDTMPTRLVHASTRTSQSTGMVGANSASNLLAHKVSPPNSSATSRLVEYPQQHVSPRKRILREFEKVSLEDNANAAVAKRSRAKSNVAASAAAPPYRGTKSPPSRTQNSGGVANVIVTSTSSTANTTQRVTTTAKTEPPTISVVTPTRLNSSYSIHSLLSGGSSSPSSSSSASKRANDQAIISNLNYQQQPHYTDPSYLRSMLASPKSPEGTLGTGGKSPSNSASKKRSPPYASPMRDLHTRSPTVSHAGGDYGRRSPHVSTTETSTTGGYKVRYSAEHGSTAHSPSHHLQQHQGFYSPFMMSPKYVPAPNTSVSPNSNITQGTTRSPRHTSAFNPTSSSTAFSSSTSANIPNVGSSVGGAGMQRELSSPRMSSTSPRDNTPRTVPKKTASIRRQFASPTASTTSSCPSPSERNVAEECATAAAPNYNTSNSGSHSVAQQQQQQQQGRKTPFGGASAHLLQRVSPSGALAGTVPSPLHYYMYPVPPNSSSSPHALGAAAAVSNSAAAASAYIPPMVPSPFYNPYINVLAALQHNPMWMQPAYAGMAQHVLPPHHLSASPGGRLPPQFQNFGYNGLSAAAMASVMQQQQQHQLASSGLLHGGQGMPMSQSPLPLASVASGAATSRRMSPQSTDNTSERHANVARGGGIASAVAPGYPNSIKDEHSSDVPLNLSKH